MVYGGDVDRRENFGANLYAADNLAQLIETIGVCEATEIIGHRTTGMDQQRVETTVGPIHVNGNLSPIIDR